MKYLKESKIYELMERSDTLTLGTLAHFRHFRHLAVRQGTFND